MTPILEAAVEAGAKAMTTDQMRSVLHASGLEFSPAQDTLIRYWARLAVEAAAPLIAPPDGAVGVLDDARIDGMRIALRILNAHVWQYSAPDSIALASMVRERIQQAIDERDFI